MKIALAALLLVIASLAHAEGGKKGQEHLLDLSTIPVVIDEPGTYVLSRNWRVDLQGGTAIRVQAPDVTIDLRGFELSATGDGGTVGVEGANFTLQNGRMGGTDNVNVFSSAPSTTIRDLRVVAGTEGFHLEGPGALVQHVRIVNSSVFLLGPLSVIDSSVVHSGRFPAVGIAGDGRVTNSEILSSSGLGMNVRGTGAVVANNVFVYGGDSPETPLRITGDNNVVLNNVFLTDVAEGRTAPAIEVVGTGNVLRDNLAPPIQGRWSTGILFEGSGNFYGNNQMAADVPFDLEAADQTDWGGNFGF